MGMELPGSAKTVTFAHPTCIMGLSKREDLYLFRLLKTLGFSFKLKTYNFLPFWKIACHYPFITSFSSFCPLVFTKFKLALFIPFSPSLNFFLIYSFCLSLWDALWIASSNLSSSAQFALLPVCIIYFNTSTIFNGLFQFFKDGIYFHNMLYLMLLFVCTFCLFFFF